MLPPPEGSTGSPALSVRPEPGAEFSPTERAQLLAIARQSILSVFENHSACLPLPSSARLTEPRGAFTTLYVGGGLRGCVGYVFPVGPLYQTVADTARGAAFEDTRFAPVGPEEAADLKISISVLSPLQLILADSVVVGRHGLLISQAGRRGLLLPQVPVEQGWDRMTFLEQTCRKAGLPVDAWKTGARLEAFTAEVFADTD